MLGGGNLFIVTYPWRAVWRAVTLSLFVIPANTCWALGSVYTLNLIKFAFHQLLEMFIENSFAVNRICLVSELQFAQQNSLIKAVMSSPYSSWSLKSWNIIMHDSGWCLHLDAISERAKLGTYDQVTRTGQQIFEELRLMQLKGW